MSGGLPAWDEGEPARAPMSADGNAELPSMDGHLSNKFARRAVSGVLAHQRATVRRREDVEPIRRGKRRGLGADRGGYFRADAGARIDRLDQPRLLDCDMAQPGRRVEEGRVGNAGKRP